jgi:hypothetical protein
MEAKDFLCSNANYDIMLNSIREMNPKDREIEIKVLDTFVGTNSMLLEVIKAYDSQKTKNNLLLQFAIDLSDVLLSKNPVSIINRFQIIKRSRDLTNDEISYLIILRNKNNQEKIIRCAICILLNEKADAKKLLDEMSEEEKKQILNYPIYSLLTEPLPHLS